MGLFDLGLGNKEQTCYNAVTQVEKVLTRPKVTRYDLSTLKIDVEAAILLNYDFFLLFFFHVCFCPCVCVLLVVFLDCSPPYTLKVVAC